MHKDFNYLNYLYITQNEKFLRLMLHCAYGSSASLCAFPFSNNLYAPNHKSMQHATFGCPFCATCVLSQMFIFNMDL